jgi:hypothetical protein
LIVTKSEEQVGSEKSVPDFSRHARDQCPIRLFQHDGAKLIVTKSEEQVGSEKSVPDFSRHALASPELNVYGPPSVEKHVAGIQLHASACKAMIPEFRYGRSKEENVAVAPRHAPFG